MPYDIIIGRDEHDKQKYGTKGTVFLGKQYVKMGPVTSLSNSIYLDVNRAHVVFVVGKRGSGKSYTMGVIAEGMADLPEEVRQNTAVVILDTMGVYWTMKYPNKPDEALLEKWGMKAKGLDVKIWSPIGYFDKLKKEGIPTDYPFAIRPSELAGTDWTKTFNVDDFSPAGVLIQRIVAVLKSKGKGEYDLDDMIAAIRSDKQSEQHDRNVAESYFATAKTWGLFSIKATELKDIVKPGQVSVLDMSIYATIPGTWGIKALAMGILSQKLFIERMISRKVEEFESIKAATHYFTEEVKKKQEFPMVWLVIDEAHEFLPRTGKTAASDALQTILREGRQPGISLILASQQPGKIHTDVMTQADVIISHRITAKIDVDALGALAQTYLREGLVTQLDELPKDKGAGIIFDDTNERSFSMSVRPRFTWHGGSAPSAIKEEKEKF